MNEESEFEIDRVVVSVVVARRENGRKVSEGVFEPTTFFLADLPYKLNELLEAAPDKALEQWKQKTLDGS